MNELTHFLNSLISYKVLYKIFTYWFDLEIKKNNNYVDLILLKLLIRDWFECFQKKRSCKHCSIVWKPFFLFGTCY